MSVKLSDLKVPPNLSVYVGHEVNEILRGSRIVSFGTPAWIRGCAVAALCWRHESDRLVADGSCGWMDAEAHADLWQRAAFEGVEQ